MFPRFRFLGLFAIVIITGALLVLSFQSPRLVQEHASGTVSLTVDFGETAREWKYIPFVTGATAFSILKDVKVPMVYDPSTGAGVFVRQIGDKKNGESGKYWQYWVNDKFELVAADKYILQQGDRVRWKFLKEQQQ